MQPQLRLHVASGSVNCLTISQVANLLVVQETAVLDWTDEISICQLLLHNLQRRKGSSGSEYFIAACILAASLG